MINCFSVEAVLELGFSRESDVKHEVNYEKVCSLEVYSCFGNLTPGKTASEGLTSDIKFCRHYEQLRSQPKIFMSVTKNY